MTPARLAILSTHPIQYHAHWFRALAARPELDLRVFYCYQGSPADQAQPPKWPMDTMRTWTGRATGRGSASAWTWGSALSGLGLTMERARSWAPPGTNGGLLDPRAGCQLVVVSDFVTRGRQSC